MCFCLKKAIQDPFLVPYNKKQILIFFNLFLTKQKNKSQMEFFLQKQQKEVIICLVFQFNSL